MVNVSAVDFCVMTLALFVGTLIGAVIVQRSCVLFNLFARFSGKRPAATVAWPPGHPLNSDADWALYERVATLPGVPRPGFDRAVRIVFFATLVNVSGTFIVFQLLRLAAEVTGYDFYGPFQVACVALPMGILVLAAMSSVMLPTHFGKGVLLSLLSHFFAAILAIAIVAIVLTFGLQNWIDFPW